MKTVMCDITWLQYVYEVLLFDGLLRPCPMIKSYWYAIKNNKKAHLTIEVWRVLNLSDDKQRNMLGNA